MNLKDITIIIPNYNGEEVLKSNLPKVIDASYNKVFEIIIVDDASTDKSVEIIKQQFPQIKLIEKLKNEGFSSTVNVGVKNASTKLVCLLNSDVIPNENFLENTLSYFDDQDTAAVGMVDISDDDKTHGRGKFIFHKGFLLHNRFDREDLAIESGITGWVSGGSGVFSKKIWDDLGGLDEIYNPFYFEDVDYGYRAWKSGYKMYVEKNATVSHIHKKGSIKSNYNENKIKITSYRNQFIFSWKNLTDLNLLMTHIMWIPINLVLALLKGDYQIIKGFMLASESLQRVINSRKDKIRLFTQRDDEIIMKFK